MKRLRQRMISILPLPSALRFLTYSRVGWWLRIRTITTRYRAALACRLPPRLSRCRFVFPLEAGIGQAPQSLAKAASERMRSGLSPTRMSISAAVPVEIPWASSMAGAQDAVKASRSASWALISASSISQRRAMARKAALVEAVAERIGPGRRAARWRISAIFDHRAAQGGLVGRAY